MTVARVPPHNLQAEESLLGAMLLSRDAIISAIEVRLTGESFYKPAHGHIYDAITSLYTRGEPADPPTVSDELTRADLLEAVGGGSVLITLQAGTPTIGNAGRYARIVEEHSLLRRLIAAGGNIEEIGYSLPTDVAEAVDQAEQLVYALRPEGDDPLQGDIAAQVQEEWLIPVQEREALGGIVQHPTGFTDLDHVTGGLEAGTLTLVAGRPGSGKTDYACNVAANVANREQVVYWSIEMGRSQILNRLICARARLPKDETARGKILSGSWPHLEQAQEYVSGLALDIRDSPSVTLLGLRAACRRVRSRRGLGLVIVDHLGLMIPTKAAQNRENEIAELAWGLKVLAKELLVPVVAMVQLNRNLESRSDKRPTLADLRDSGRLEEAADIVIGIFREEYYKPDTTSPGIAEMLVLKQRNGRTRPVRVRADVVTGWWGDLSQREAV